MSNDKTVIGVFVENNSRLGYEYEYEYLLELNPTFEDAWIAIGERFDNADLPELIKQFEFLSYDEILDDHLVDVHIEIYNIGYCIDDGWDSRKVYMKKLEVRSRQ